MSSLTQTGAASTQSLYLQAGINSGGTGGGRGEGNQEEELLFTAGTVEIRTRVNTSAATQITV